jgi:hypothetical protein
MPLNLASPGILVREVDLTVGRIDPTSDKIGAIVGPFDKGPVELPVLVQTEKDLIEVFGKPHSTDKQYETWMSASSYLAYGGSLQIIRADDNGLVNAGVGGTTKIKNRDHYQQLGYDDSVIPSIIFAARTPGSWANGLRVGVIDAKADQIITLDTAGLTVGMGVTQSLLGKVKIGAGTTSALDGHLKGVITGVYSNKVDVKVLSHVSADGTEVTVDYQPDGVWLFGDGVLGIHSVGAGTSSSALTPGAIADWYEQQELVVSTAVVGTATTEVKVKWSSVAERPSTTNYAASRGSRFDEMHVVVIDGDGVITGNAGTILEKHLGVSKATDAEYSAGSPAYWRRYLASNSSYVYGGSEPAGTVVTGYSYGFTLATNGNWDALVEGVIFDSIGSYNSKLIGGADYSGGTKISDTGSLSAGLSSIVSGYSLLENSDQYDCDFLIMPTGNLEKSEAQALANKLIAVAESRKDAVAFISPYRKAFITDTSVGSVTIENSETATNNVISFYAPITASSYAVFDSGYKYMYDRFNNTFRYVPLAADVAGTCARNDINQFPWFSPAGTVRGTILNAIKLAYNPSKVERDRLYGNRINPVIFSPGAGIVLFGDKTAMAKASAFDRINVRRLFIYLEDAISAAAKDQLFEFNDEITRTNFVNVVEPFLRDVQSKRGIFDYVVVCDETNNTAAVIDNNEFVAEIYIKPARSINFVGLTFVATRSGVAFEEVIGNV